MPQDDSFIDEQGHSKLSKEEHFAELKKWHQKTGSLKGFKQKYGLYVDPVKGPMMARAFTNAQGQHYTYNSMKSRGANDARRKAQENPDQVRHRFKTDAEFKRFKNWLKDGNKRNEGLASKASESGTKFEKGHVKALNAGGAHGPPDQRLETTLGNRSTTDRFEIPDDRLTSSTTATSWDDLVDKYLDPTQRNSSLTPQDKQRIWQGESPDTVIGQRQQAIKANPLAKPNANRVGVTIDAARRSNLIETQGLDPKDFTVKGANGKTLRMNGLGGAAGLMLDPEAAKKFAEGDYIGGLQTGAKSAVYGEFTSQAIQKVSPHLGKLFAGAARYVAPVAKVASPIGQTVVGTQVANELVKAGTGEGFVKKLQNVQDKQRTATINAQQQQTSQQLAIKRKQTGQNQSVADNITNVIAKGANNLEYAIKNPLSIFGV